MPLFCSEGVEGSFCLQELGARPTTTTDAVFPLLGDALMETAEPFLSTVTQEPLSLRHRWELILHCSLLWDTYLIMGLVSLVQGPCQRSVGH